MQRHHSFRCRLSARLPTPAAAMAAILVLAACGESVGPSDDLLADLDEMAVYMAVVDRVTPFNHTAEANFNLRLALGSAIPPSAPIPDELFGHTLVYVVDEDDWRANPAPTLPANALRVTWYEVAGPFVSVPVVERGYIELERRDDPLLDRLDVRAVRTDGATRTLADYTARFGDAETPSGPARLFHATGQVSDGERSVSFDTRREDLDAPAGEGGSSYRLDLTDQGFSYAARLVETGAGPATLVQFDASVAVSSVETRLELSLEERPDAPLAGSGVLYHGGRKLADVQVAGSDMTFHRADGTPFRQVDQQRLGMLASVLFIPIAVVEPYFS